MDSHSSHVVDAAIWIDLEEGGLIAAFLQLPMDWYAPDVLVEDIGEERQAFLEAEGVQFVELPGEQVREVELLALKWRGPSRVDLFTLVLARWRGFGLLTGDAALRRAAEKEEVEVHGSLWVLDQMIAHCVVTRAEAADALERMVAAGARLPRPEVERRMREWRGFEG